MSEDFPALMRRAGWRHDIATNGFRKGDLWVSWGQAERALGAAERGEAIEAPTAQSETLARIIESAANE